MKKVSKASKIRSIRGSDNVFADLNLPGADELLAKANLVLVLSDAIRAQRLTQAAAARRLGLTQPKISRLLRGQTEGFSLDRILALLRHVGKNVDIAITQAPARAVSGRVRVSVKQRMYAAAKK